MNKTLCFHSMIGVIVTSNNCWLEWRMVLR